MLKIKTLIFNPFRENTYLVCDSLGRCVIVDPGCDSPAEVQQLENLVREEGLSPVRVLITHGHVDHTYGAARCAQKYGIPVYMSSLDKETLGWMDERLSFMHIHHPEDFESTDARDGEMIGEGELECKVIATPGHSRGGVCYLFEKDKIIFTGDTLFAGCIGRTDFFGSSLDDLLEGIRTKLMVLDGDIEVLPGHGSATDIATERTTNPFIFEQECLTGDEK